MPTLIIIRKEIIMKTSSKLASALLFTALLTTSVSFPITAYARGEEAAINRNDTSISSITDRTNSRAESRLSPYNSNNYNCRNANNSGNSNCDMSNKGYDDNNMSNNNMESSNTTYNSNTSTNRGKYNSRTGRY